jgi:hypothetical protein
VESIFLVKVVAANAVTNLVESYISLLPTPSVSLSILGYQWRSGWSEMLAKHTMAVMFSKAGKKMEYVFTSMNISSAPSTRYVLNNAKLSRGGVKISSATGRGIKSRNSARGLMQRMLSLLKETRYVFTFFQTVNRQRDSENGRPRQDGINDRLRRCCQQHRFS